MSSRYAEQNKEKLRRKRKAMYVKHRERLKAERRDYYWKNRESCTAAHRSYMATRKDMRSAHERNRIAKKKLAGGTHTPQDILDILLNQGGRCVYCRCDISLGREVDHIQPIARGGRNDKSNLQLLCKGCNRRKHSKTHEEFQATLTLRATD